MIRRRRAADEAFQSRPGGGDMRGFTLANAIVVAIVAVVVGVAAILLARTVQNAQTINDKAQNIARVGRGINIATDSVIQLNRTNRSATSILRSASPLEGQLDDIVGEARRINGLAGSINGTAGAINSTARTVNGTAIDINDTAGQINQTARDINSSAGSILGSAETINGTAGQILSSASTINGTARGISTSARRILGTARRINTDVSLINRNLDVTLGIARGIKADTGNILGQAEAAHSNATCIDRHVLGAASGDGDCRGATGASTRGREPTPEEAKSLKKLKDLIRERGNVDKLPSAPVPNVGSGSAPESPGSGQEVSPEEGETPGVVPAPVPQTQAPERVPGWLERLIG
jgi:hypothetical protein